MRHTTIRAVSLAYLDLGGNNIVLVLLFLLRFFSLTLVASITLLPRNWKRWKRQLDLLDICVIHTRVLFQISLDAFHRCGRLRINLWGRVGSIMYLWHIYAGYQVSIETRYVFFTRVGGMVKTRRVKLQL